MFNCLFTVCCCTKLFIFYSLFTGIIKCITLTTFYMNSMWWSPHSSLGGKMNQGLFLILSALSMFNYVMATLCGPGFLPLKWHPTVIIIWWKMRKKNFPLKDINWFSPRSPHFYQDKKAKKLLQYCKVCEGYKAPRSHHCRKCGRCVIKMDHHCPWLNGVSIEWEIESKNKDWFQAHVWKI